jgi:hypothetical protein
VSSPLANSLLRQVPPPKPPDLGDSGNGKGDQKMEDYLREGEKKLEEIRVKWAFDDKVRTKRTFSKLSRSFNLMSQTQAIFCLILEEVATWAGIKLVGLVKFNDSKETLKKGGTISKIPKLVCLELMSQVQLPNKEDKVWGTTPVFEYTKQSSTLTFQERLIGDVMMKYAMPFLEFIYKPLMTQVSSWNFDGSIVILQCVGNGKVGNILENFNDIIVCVVGDGTTITTVGGHLMNLKLRKAFSRRDSWFMMLFQSVIGMYCHCDSLSGVRKLLEGLNVLEIISWNSLISNYEGCGNVFIVLKQISAQIFFESSSHIDSRVPLNCYGILGITNLGIGLETNSYSLELINEDVINYIKQIIKLTSLNWDSIKGIVKILGIEETAALTKWHNQSIARDDDIFGPICWESKVAKWEGGKLCSWSSLIDRNGLLPTGLIEMLMQFWNLEGMKAGVAFEIMCRHAFIQWDPGELNFLSATTANDYCLCDFSLCDLLIFHGWFHFVFDRGKF